MIQSPAPSRAQPAAGAYTYHDDAMRTGAVTNETVLTPSNVSAAAFRLRLKGAGGTPASEQQVSRVSADVYWFTGMPAALGTIAP